MSGWSAVGSFGVALVAMLPAFGSLVWAASFDHEANVYAVLMSVPAFYVAIVAFLISVLIEPAKRRAQSFGILPALYLGLLIFELTKRA